MEKKRGFKEILSNSNEIKVLAGESSLKLLEEIMIKRFQELNNEIQFGGKIRNFNIQNPHLFTQALKEIIKMDINLNKKTFFEEEVMPKYNSIWKPIVGSAGKIKADEGTLQILEETVQENILLLSAPGVVIVFSLHKN